MIVDASVLVDVVTESPGSPLRTRLTDERTLHAPCLLDAEFLHAVRSLERRGQLTGQDGLLALHYLRALPIRRHGMESLVPRMWYLRDNVTAYDAAYVALAELLALPLLTADARLAAAPGLRCQVVLA